jgi:hypothetical protein
MATSTTPALVVPRQKKPRESRGAFFLVRPTGRTYLEVKVLYSPGKGKS